MLHHRRIGTYLVAALLVAAWGTAWAGETVTGLPPAAEEMIRLYSNRKLWFDTYWLGVRSAQTPTDNWMMQEIISEIEPDYIIETGTFLGGTTLYYASVLSFVNENGKVITVDISSRVTKAKKFKVFQEKVEVVIGSSVAPEVVNPIRERVKGHKVLVTLDSLHTKEHVLKEMELYGPMVSKGSYLVVQDTAAALVPSFGPGPKEAVEEFLKTHKEFVVDRSREKFLLTFYPGGYLKKVE